MLIGRTGQGASLFCDDDRQSTEFSQLVYHEAMVVPGFLLAGKLDQVLIIGSSEGVVSELAVAAGATRVDHVDIDGIVATVRLLASGNQRLALGKTNLARVVLDDLGRILLMFSCHVLP